MNDRRLLYGLLGSLALNLFLVGLGVGAWALGPRLMQPAPVAAQGQGRAPAPLWASGRVLSPQYRPAFNAVLRKALVERGADVREAAAIRRRAFDAMADGRFDSGRVTADLDRARALEVAARARIERDMVAFAETLPARERANLAEAMRAAMTRRVSDRYRGQWDSRRQDAAPAVIAPPAGERP